LFSKVVNKLTFPPAVNEGSFFPASSPTFDGGGGLICISFMARDGEHFFHVFFGHLDFFL
jgi:hypothetical protein